MEKKQLNEKDFHDYGYKNFKKFFHKGEKLPSLKDYDINEEIHKLFQDEPFLLEVSVYVKKIKDPTIPTAMVSLTNDGEFVWHFNPTFMIQFPWEMRKAIAIHENTHIFAGHLLKYDKTVASNIIHNYAWDLAINSMPKLHEFIPEKCLDGITGEEVTLIKPGLGQFSWIKERGESWNFYINKLLKNPDKVPQDPEGSKIGGDVHKPLEGSGNGEPLTEEQEAEIENVQRMAEEQLNHIVKNSMEKIANEYDSTPENADKFWGSVSKQIRKIIISRTKVKSLGPEEILRNFIGSVGKSDRVKTWTKLNRRVPYLKPGRRYNPNPKIMFCVDQSGSVGMELLAKFHGFIEQYKNYIDFYVVPFDTSVLEKKIIFWEKGKTIKLERELSGGTDFNAPTHYANRRGDIDGIIICTDLYAPKPKNCNHPRLWVTDNTDRNLQKEVCGKELCIVIK